MRERQKCMEGECECMEDVTWAKVPLLTMRGGAGSTRPYEAGPSPVESARGSQGS